MLCPLVISIALELLDMYLEINFPSLLPACLPSFVSLSLPSISPFFPPHSAVSFFLPSFRLVFLSSLQSFVSSCLPSIPPSFLLSFLLACLVFVFPPFLHFFLTLCVRLQILQNAAAVITKCAG